jgi:hypothetical protein
MSGGYFDYDQYKIANIASTIDDLIFHNGSEEKDSYGDNRYRSYPEDMIEEFKKAVNILREAEVYVQRIDWLVSDDDGEESFRSRLKSDLGKLDFYELKL